MRISDEKKRQIISDLGLNTRFVKGSDIPVRNCWHFYTDGSSVDSLFLDDKDFKAGMNRIYVLSRCFNIVILAFTLMDTHVHFILHGEYPVCCNFLREFIRLTSMHIFKRRGDRNKLSGVKLGHQNIDNDRYLKTAVCYVLRNAPVGGLPFNYYDYPWSSGALMFRHRDYWTSPVWTSESYSGQYRLSQRQMRVKLNTRKVLDESVIFQNGMVHPGEYVAYELVERLFSSCRSFHYFMGLAKEADIEARGGTVSSLSLPLQEMRMHKYELCRELFAKNDVRSLDTSQRILLARTLKARYNSSVKQIVRLCGLKYEEVKNLL